MRFSPHVNTPCHRHEYSAFFAQGIELAKVAQQYAQQQGLPIPGLSGNPNGQNQGGLAGSLQGLAGALGGGNNANNNGFNTTGATAAGFGGLAALSGPYTGSFGNNRSDSFTGSPGFAQDRGGFGQRQGSFGRQGSFSQQQQGFGQQQGYGFDPQQGYGYDQLGGYGQQGGYGDPMQGFSGAMTTQGQQGYSPQLASPWSVHQNQWAQNQQQLPVPGFTNGFASEIVPQPGFGQSFGQTTPRGQGGSFWPSAGMAGAGLAGAGLASGYNQGYGGAALGGYGQPGYGYGGQASAYGGPPILSSMPGKGGSGKGGGGKGGGGKGGGGKGGGGGKPPGGVTEQPVGPMPMAGWLHVPPGFDLPEGIPKGLEVSVGCGL